MGDEVVEAIAQLLIFVGKVLIVLGLCATFKHYGIL